MATHIVGYMDRLMKMSASVTIDRREALMLGAGTLLAAMLPKAGFATPAEVSTAISDAFGSGTISEGRIAVSVPKLAETGNSVPVSIAVDSPMTVADHVRRIAIFAEQNPRPKVVEVFLSPASGEARLETKIRLSGTQGVVVVAEMSDGSLWRTREQVQVVVGACTTLPARY